MQTDNLQLLTTCITLFNLGFFGGFLHCSSMCSPFVIHQVSSRLKNQELEKYTGFTRLRNLALLPYHCGRILTYSIIGMSCSYLAGNVRDIGIFKIFSGSVLILAALLMMLPVFKKNILNFNSLGKLFRFIGKFSIFIDLSKVSKRLLSNLFNNPTSYRGFILGVSLGFLPCGLLYSAFIITASIENVSDAFFAMMIFGISTFPALFLVASAGYIFLNYAKSYIKFIARLVILINSATIFIMGINFIIN